MESLTSNGIKIQKLEYRSQTTTILNQFRKDQYSYIYGLVLLIYCNICIAELLGFLVLLSRVIKNFTHKYFEWSTFYILPLNLKRHT